MKISVTMRRAAAPVAVFALAAIAVAAVRPDPDPAPAPAWGLVVHGGAGTILRENMTAAQEAEYRAKLTEAIGAGHAVLARGGSSLDAIEATIHILEDSPLFNAGKGAVFTAEGTNELDASIMWGPTRAAGAVAGVKHVKHPISLARAVMEKSPHVFMAREGAEAFAREHGLEMVPAEYFRTEHRWEQLQRAKAAERQKAGASLDPEHGDFKFGTVGVVALDKQGNLAAGTSTGGMTNKRFGRIGDSPVIGAGNYADEQCAVSATGHGEFFIRYTVASDICARVRYHGMPLADAADAVIMGTLAPIDADGGVVAMDRAGNIAMPFNTPGMYRGFAKQDGKVHVFIYRDE